MYRQFIVVCDLTVHIRTMPLLPLTVRSLDGRLPRTAGAASCHMSERYRFCHGSCSPVAYLVLCFKRIGEYPVTVCVSTCVIIDRSRSRSSVVLARKACVDYNALVFGDYGCLACHALARKAHQIRRATVLFCRPGRYMANCSCAMYRPGVRDGMKRGRGGGRRQWRQWRHMLRSMGMMNVDVAVAMVGFYGGNRSCWYPVAQRKGMSSQNRCLESPQRLLGVANILFCKRRLRGKVVEKKTRLGRGQNESDWKMWTEGFGNHRLPGKAKRAPNFGERPHAKGPTSSARLAYDKKNHHNTF